jgi:hypothetical protein
MAEFYPGGSLRVGGGGGGGTTTYASYGIPSVGALYTGILVSELVLVVVGAFAAIWGLVLSRGVGSSARVRRAARGMLLGTTILAAVIVVAVPALQSTLYHHDNPVGSCSSTTPAGPCYSFWGITQGSGTTTSWGAGLGWWLGLGSAVLLAAAFQTGASSVSARSSLSAGRLARREPLSDVREVPSTPDPPIAIADLRRLVELRSQSDLGQVPREEFLEAKRRLLAAAPASASGGPGPQTPLPSAELSLLKSLYDSGALTEEEYRLLERRALLWI